MRHFKACSCNADQFDNNKGTKIFTAPNVGQSGLE